MLPPTAHPDMERRRGGQRQIATLPFNFANFNNSRLHREHHGLICNQSRSGACFQTSQRCKPGTIVFMRKHPGETAEATRLAEIRWCTPLKAKDQDRTSAKWSIGVRYL